jgi:hypothetical protein
MRDPNSKLSPQELSTGLNTDARKWDQELTRDENGFTMERSRLAGHLRGHCEGKIPGYMGFIPRVHGESIFGAGSTAINKMAADICEDHTYNPTDHGKRCSAPQFPDARRLRM